jgi:hypothetical protein
MSWPIRFLDKPPLHASNADSRHYDGTVDFDKRVVGDICYYHYQGKPCMDRAHLERLHLTAHYFAHNSGRPPLILALPDKAYPNGKLYFMVDGQCYSGQCAKCGNKRTACKCGDSYQPKGYYDGWTVSGTPPLITVSPSVNYDEDDGPKHYHGFIQNGVIGDG